MVKDPSRLAKAAARADKMGVLGSDAYNVALSAIHLRLVTNPEWNAAQLTRDAQLAVQTEARKVQASMGIAWRNVTGARFAAYWASPVDPEDPRLARVLEVLAVQQTLARLAPEERSLLDLLSRHQTRRAVALTLGKDEWTIGRRVRAAIDHFLEVYRDDQ
jgi:hypothetical protein